MKTVGRRGGGPAARQRDTLQVSLRNDIFWFGSHLARGKEFDESINEFHNEINSNLSLLRALKVQDVCLTVNSDIDNAACVSNIRHKRANIGRRVKC